jgi:hypothetical protein
MEYDSTSEVHLRAHKISEYHAVEILYGCNITKNISYADYKVIRNIFTVQFPYIETCGVRKWGKTKKKGDAVMRLVESS